MGTNEQRRNNVSSLFSSRRKSTSRPAPTLVISDEMQNETSPDGRSVGGGGANSKTALESPTQTLPPDSRHGRQTGEMRSTGKVRVTYGGTG